MSQSANVGSRGTTLANLLKRLGAAFTLHRLADKLSALGFALDRFGRPDGDFRRNFGVVVGEMAIFHYCGVPLDGSKLAVDELQRAYNSKGLVAMHSEP